jgi:outer membrane receptor protein involved in Fe transport
MEAFMKGFTSSMRVWAILAFTLLLACNFAFAQSEQGTLSGTITDPSGAAITNAKITVTNTATNQARSVATSPSGQYTVTALPPATYSVKVEAQGFATFEAKIAIAVGSRATLDPKLAVNAGGQSIEVTAEASAVQVDTSDQTLGATINSTQVMELPSLTRNAYDFVATAGNVSEGDSGDTKRGVGVSINGARQSSTGILLDGAENVDLFTASTGQQVPMDSIQEYRVLTSNFTAEYGRAAGGVVNVATKSGSNSWHGSGYEYNRVSALASNTWDYNAKNFSNKAQGLDELPKAGFTRNQFGYSLGGPIKKDKAFFFSNTEWTRVRSAQNFTAYIFDPAFIATTNAATKSYWNAYGKPASGVSNIGAPITAGQIAAGLPGFGNVTNPDPTKGSPVFMAQAALNPNLAVLQLVNMSVPADSGAGAPQNTYNMVHRVDYSMSDKTQIWGRYALYSEMDFDGYNAYSPYAGFNTGVKVYNQNATLSVNHVFSPSLVDTFKFSFNRLNNTQPLGDQAPAPSLYLSSSVPNINGVANAYLPGYLPYSQSNAIPFGGPQNVAQFGDTLSWTKGSHNFTFGGEYIYTKDNRVFGAYENGVADLAKSYGQSLDALLAGTIYSYNVALNPQGLTPCYTDRHTTATINPASCTLNLPAVQPKFDRMNRFHDGAMFAQDTWKFNNRWTFNLGLRWEYFGVQHNNDSSLDSNFYYSGALNPASVEAGGVLLADKSTVGGLWNPSKKNFAPRIGFAWDVFGDGRTSLRGGYGISYERNFGNVTFNVIQNPPNYAVISLSSAAGYPLPTDNLGPFAATSGTKVLPPTTLRGVDPNIKTAYTDMYSLSLERELMKGTLVALEYSGARGIHQYSITNVNRYFGAYAYNQIPYGSISTSTSSAGLEAQRTNTEYGNIHFRGSDGDYWYNGMNFRAQSNNFLNKGLQFTFNYTWSHTLDDLSSTFTETQSGASQGSLGFLDWMNPKFDRGDSDYDARHRVTFSAVYEPKLKFKNKAMSIIGEGWSIAPMWNWHSGTPFTLYDCGNEWGICSRALVIDNAGSVYPTSYTDPIGKPNTFSYFQYGTYSPYNATIDGVAVGATDIPSCNAGVCAFPSNMVRRNSARVPNVWTTNLGVYKNFSLTERFKLQLRAEAYNLFNHSNYYVNYGDTDMENCDLDPVTNKCAIGAKVSANKGNGLERRNMQLAIRLSF